MIGSVKLFSHLFYRLDVSWVEETSDDAWNNLRVAAFLNHTSLYEVLFFAALPNRILWRFARKGVVPGADKTLARPVVGLFFRLLTRKMVSISRRRDHTWTEFLKVVSEDSMVVMAPEGRMKRPSGLDLQGNPMTVRGGIADVLDGVRTGNMLLAYSGGLHHVQVPGQTFPKLFQTIRIRLDIVDIADYVQSMGIDGDPAAYKVAVIQDLERRRDLHCPTLEQET